MENNPLLQAVGESDISVHILFKGDQSVGIWSRSFEMKIPNQFYAAGSDEECREWIEDARKRIKELYDHLDGDELAHVIFDWEVKADIEFQNYIDESFNEMAKEAKSMRDSDTRMPE